MQPGKQNHTASFPGCAYMSKPTPRRFNREHNLSYAAATAAAPTRATAINLPLDDNGAFPSLQQKITNQMIGTPIHSGSSVSNDNLFNIQELQTIMSEILTNLRNCKTKEQQFNVMFTLAAKYVYGP